MESILIMILLMWITGPHSKMYYIIAAIRPIMLLIVFPAIGIITGITNLILIPWIVPKVKTAITKKDE